MAYKIPIELIELESENYHILVSSVFGDKETGRWVIDTGASKSVFDINLQEHILYSYGESEDLHSAGISDEPIKGQLAQLKPLIFSGLKIYDMKVVALDLSHINKLYESSAGIEICGLLGSDFLVRYKATIDFRRKTMTLRK